MVERRRGRPPSGNKGYTIPLPPDLVEAAKRVAAKRRARGERCVYGDLVREGLAMRLAAASEEEQRVLFTERRSPVLPNLALVKCPPIGMVVDEVLVDELVDALSVLALLQPDQDNP